MVCFLLGLKGTKSKSGPPDMLMCEQYFASTNAIEN
jgi:hypothetical protein